MPTNLKIFIKVIVVSVIAAVVYGLFLLGSPAQQRLIKLDQQRVSDIQSISYAINAYWGYNKKLPATLEVLVKSQDYYISSLKDPTTGEYYEYRILGEKQYELCANFNTDSSNFQNVSLPKPASEEKWEYRKGATCFSREAYSEGR